MAWRRPGDKPLSEPRMESLLTHICISRPQWVKAMMTYCPLEPYDVTIAQLNINSNILGQGWWLQSQFPSFCYSLNFSIMSKHTLAIEYNVYIWQVSPQLSCGDTCQIWMWFKESNRYFCKTEIFVYGKINKWSFSNPQPRKTILEMASTKISQRCLGDLR